MTETTFKDQTNRDGDYQYTVASVRQDNQQEALSAQSEIVSVTTDRHAPAAPHNLRLELQGAGVVARWDAGSSEQLRYRLYRESA